MEYVREGRNYIITLIIILVISALWLDYISSPPGGDDTPVMFVIPKGATAAAVGTKLETAGLIRSEFIFRLLARTVRESQETKPGAYKLNRTMTMRQMLDIMGKGLISASWVTVPEGFTIRQIADKLDEKRLMAKGRFMAIANQDSYEFRNIVHIPAQSLEGYLFPDTYLVPIDADPKETVSEMLENFNKRVAKPLSLEFDKYVNGAGPVAKSEAMYRIITVASMIEREAKAPKDRSLISAVIWNRLRRGMKLEIDATVLYALGEHRTRLYKRDLAVDSPYNTYKYAGLPLGPIANPGLESIKAALHPARVSYLYYVARPDGSHIFSNTLEQHNAAKARIEHGE